jgi:hypothetical protein
MRKNGGKMAAMGRRVDHESAAMELLGWVGRH